MQGAKKLPALFLFQLCTALYYLHISDFLLLRDVHETQLHSLDVVGHVGLVPGAVVQVIIIDQDHLVEDLLDF